MTYTLFYHHHGDVVDVIVMLKQALDRADFAEKKAASCEEGQRRALQELFDGGSCIGRYRCLCVCVMAIASSLLYS